MSRDAHVERGGCRRPKIEHVHIVWRAWRQHLPFSEHTIDSKNAQLLTVQPHYTIISYVSRRVGTGVWVS